jgi:PIN domain nuclease of toxin-antitoxin system
VILADTHAWFWWLRESPKLSSAARHALDAETVAVASISLWEIALLANRGRIELAYPVEEWLRIALTRPNTTTLDLSPAIAATGAAFGKSVQKDPADRIIMATAVHHGLRLVTTDQRISSSGLVETVW